VDSNTESYGILILTVKNYLQFVGKKYLQVKTGISGKRRKIGTPTK
jgi:hypothetical protein